MKKTITILLGMVVIQHCASQMPVSWTYTAKKISNNTYEVRLKANISDGWHLYAQEQSGDFLGNPTKVKFNKHPLVMFSGKTKEIGKLEKTKDPVLEIESGYYSDEVEFVQKVTVKKNARTTVSGMIEFQVCTDEKC